MRKFTLLLGGCLLIASSMTAHTAVTSPEHQLTLKAAITQSTKPAELKKPANAIERKAPVRNLPFRDGKIKMAKSAKAAGLPDIIMEAPAGKTVTYKKSSAGIFPYIFWLMEYSNDCIQSEIVFTDDNEVYFKDILYYASTGAYVKGTLADGVISVDTGQYIYYSEDAGYGLTLEALMPDDDDMYKVDTAKDKITFTCADDGTITLDEDTTLGLVWTNDNSWGYVDYYQTYTVFTDTPVTKPESVVAEKWAMTTPNGNGHLLNIGIDGSDIYIGGLSEDLPDAWIKGTIDGDKATFDTKQYMGVYSDTYQYFMVADSEPDETGEMYYTLTEEPVVLEYDATAKTLTTPQGKTLIVNGSTSRIYYLELLESPSMYYFDGYKPATPANPFNLYTDGYDAGYNSGTFDFTLPLVDTDGKLLDPTCYFYNIFVDGELFTFYSDEYEELTYDELTNVPYDYTDLWDITVNGPQHSIYYYFDGFETIGVQSIYTVDGVTNKSDLVTYNVETGETNTVKDPTTSLETLVGSREVKEVTYYDLTGRKLASPATGSLVIKRTTYTDGSVESMKYMSK